METVLGVLCKSGLATMSELLDANGVWDRSLMDLMLPVAREMEAEQTEREFTATVAAVSCLVNKKGARDFHDGIALVKAEVRKAQLAARGVEGQDGPAGAAQGNTPAERLIRIFQKWGINAPAKRHVAKAPRAERGPTRMGA